jgi:hypothetical protein
VTGGADGVDFFAVFLAVLFAVVFVVRRRGVGPSVMRGVPCRLSKPALRGHLTVERPST